MNKGSFPQMPPSSTDIWDKLPAYYEEVDTYMRGVLDAEAEKDAPRDKTPSVLVEGHEVSGDDPVAPQIFEWIDLLHNKGYDYKVGYAQSFVPAYNKASRDKVMDWSYVEGVKRGKPKVHLVYGRESGTNKWTNGGSWVYGRGQMGLKEIQREVER